MVWLVLENDVQSMYDSRDPSQNCQKNIDEQVSSTASLEKDTQGREDDSDKDLANV